MFPARYFVHVITSHDVLRRDVHETFQPETESETETLNPETETETFSTDTETETLPKLSETRPRRSNRYHIRWTKKTV
jgi:hypothetical protein